MQDEHAIRLIRTVFGLARRRATGLLEITSDERKARLSFSRGRLVFAEHKSLGSTLGAYLVTRGILSRSQYQHIAEHVRHRTDRSPMLAFVEQAVVAGVLDVEQASTLVAGQVERNVVELFVWDSFDCRFTADEGVDEGPRFPCELEPLILQGVRARFDLATARAHLASRADLYPRTEASASDLVRMFRLQPAELRVARALTGERSVSELLDADSGLEPTAAAHVLLVLKLAQHIEWADAPGGEGSSQDSSPAHAVPLAAIKLAKGAPSVRLTLPAPPSVSEIDAASAFRRGVAAWKRGELEAACAQLAKAVETLHHPEHTLYAAWVDHEHAGQPRSAEAFAQLAAAARGALEHDATLAFGYYVVGHLHLMQNDPLNAELAFRRAAKLDPTDSRAQDEADRLRAARHGRVQP